MEKPLNLSTPIRPAKDSDTPFIKFGETLPSTRNLALQFGLSMTTRNVSKNSGIR